MAFKKMSLMDIFWTFGIFVGCLTIFLSNLSNTLTNTRSWIVLVLIALWSFRLGIHLLKSRIFTNGEDRRYIRLRDYLGKLYHTIFFILYLVQVLLILLFLITIENAIKYYTSYVTPFDIIGILVGLIGIIGESVSDYQLKKFKSDNKCKVCKIGLWRYSRHPNYFFEFVFWCSFVFISVGSTSFYFALIAPLVMYIFLRYVSGVPFAEISSLKSKGDSYKIYQNETSIFFPRKPKL